MSSPKDNGIDGQEEQKLQYTIAPETRRKWEMKKQQCQIQFQRDIDDILSSQKIKPLLKKFLHRFKDEQDWQ